MMTDVEKVARAICESYGCDPDGLDATVICAADNTPLPLWQAYEEQALAALAALTPQDRKSTIEQAGLRERVAREIEPEGFAWLDEITTNPPADEDDPRLFDPWPARIGASYEKADAILAMLPGGGWRTDAFTHIEGAAMLLHGVDQREPRSWADLTEDDRDNYRGMVTNLGLSALPEGEK